MRCKSGVRISLVEQYGAEYVIGRVTVVGRLARYSANCLILLDRSISISFSYVSFQIWENFPVWEIVACCHAT